MTRIIDLGNGYGRVERYTSKHASLTFPLKPPQIGWLYAEGYLSRDEAIKAYLDMGYSMAHAKWFVGLANVTIEQWKDGLANARTI